MGVLFNTSMQQTFSLGKRNRGIFSDIPDSAFFLYPNKQLIIPTIQAEFRVNKNHEENELYCIFLKELSFLLQDHQFKLEHKTMFHSTDFLTHTINTPLSIVAHSNSDTKDKCVLFLIKNMSSISSFLEKNDNFPSPATNFANNYVANLVGYSCNTTV